MSTTIERVTALQETADKTPGCTGSVITIERGEIVFQAYFSQAVQTKEAPNLEATLKPQPVPESVRNNYTHSDTKRNAIIKERWTEDTDKERAENKGVLRRFWVGEWDEAMAKELSLSKFVVTSRRQNLGCVVCQRPRGKQRNLELAGGSHGKKKV